MPKTILAVWGSGLSTILGIVQLVKHFREKPRLRISAEFNLTPTTPDEETKGRKVETPHGLQQAQILVRISNAGRRPMQVIACYVDLSGTEDANRVEIVPPEMPTTINPNTCAQCFLQTEWLESADVCAFGAIDALGKPHPIAKSSLKSLAEKCGALPGAGKQLVDPGTGEPVLAFFAKDPGVIRKLKD